MQVKLFSEHNGSLIPPACCWSTYSQNTHSTHIQCAQTQQQVAFDRENEKNKLHSVSGILEQSRAQPPPPKEDGGWIWGRHIGRLESTLTPTARPVLQIGSRQQTMWCVRLMRRGADWADKQRWEVLQKAPDAVLLSLRRRALFCRRVAQTRFTFGRFLSRTLSCLQWRRFTCDWESLAVTEWLNVADLESAQRPLSRGSTETWAVVPFFIYLFFYLQSSVTTKCPNLTSIFERPNPNHTLIRVSMP